MNSMDYAICFRKEAQFCTQSYFLTQSNASNDNSNRGLFHIINYRENSGSPTIDEGLGGTGLNYCPHDYLLLNSMRLCGWKLNSNSFNSPRDYDERITDSSNGPFIAR